MSGSTRAEEAAAKVALWRGKPITISALSGGLTNENYLVECTGSRYVLRLPGQSTELLSIDRENEVYNTKAAASTGIAPKVLEHVGGLDVMVLEFIDGQTMSAGTLQSSGMTARMAQSFHRLHAARDSCMTSTCSSSSRLPYRGAAPGGDPRTTATGWAPAEIGTPPARPACPRRPVTAAFVRTSATGRRWIVDYS
jgi:hypothetical protein